MKKRILIRVDANAHIGWGHFFRCLSLAQMLQECFSLIVAMAAPLPQARELLQTKGFELIALPGQSYTPPDQKGDNELSFDLNEHLNGIDLVLLDGYWFGPKYQQTLREHSIKVAMVEDAGEGIYLADLIINHVPGLQPANYQVDNDEARFALGSDYALLRPAFLQAAKQGKETTANKQVLICFGGSDQYDYTGKAYAAIKALDESLKFLIILGPSYAHREQLEALIGANPNVTIQSNLNEQEMVEAMTGSELAVVPSSGILYECLAIGNKVVTVQCAENQKHFHAVFSQLPQVSSAGGFTTEEIIVAFEEAMNYEGGRTRVIDGESGDRLSQLISELLESEAPENLVKTLNYTEIQGVIPQIIAVEANVYEAHGALYDTEPWHESNFLYQLPEKEAFSTYLIHRGQVKGFSIAYEFQPAYCHISRVAIHTEMAGKGLGRQLLQSQLERMAANGITTCSIDLIVENAPAYDFYTKLGFERLTDKALEAYVELKGREASEYLGHSPSHMAMILKF